MLQIRVTESFLFPELPTNSSALANVSGITAGTVSVGGPLSEALIDRATLTRGLCASTWFYDAATGDLPLSVPDRNCP